MLLPNAELAETVRRPPGICPPPLKPSKPYCCGSGGGGWLWVHTDYNAPGAWSVIRNSLINFDRNRWYHSGRANAFWMPQGQIGYSAFRSDLQLANPRFEVNSTFQQTAPTLSCSMP